MYGSCDLCQLDIGLFSLSVLGRGAGVDPLRGGVALTPPCSKRRELDQCENSFW
jgi:hypothetical protein